MFLIQSLCLLAATCSNFSNFDARFSMYNSQQRRINNHYHSFNIGPVHFVSLSTEFYFYLQYGYKQIQYQYEWLIKDLTEANKKENRANRPWIFVLAHRPMYCTNIGASHKTCFISKYLNRTLYKIDMMIMMLILKYWRISSLGR